MKRLSTLIAASFLATSAFAAEKSDEAKHVASLTSQAGTVLVNKGEEFVTAADTESLLAGDRVMVMEGSNAEITFADGCVLPLEAGSLFAVPAESTCVAGKVADVQRLGPTYAQAVGATRDDDDRTAEWIVFGTSGAYIMYMILKDDYSITPPPPPPPISP